MNSMVTNLIDELASQPLAIQGGPKANPRHEAHTDMFHWPIVTDEDIDAVTGVMRAGTFSQTDITKKFEYEWGQYIGTKYNLGYPNGTMALQVAMWCAGVRRGDEIICPSITYWASILQCFSLGATAVFSDVEPRTLCIDPDDIEKHITDKTKALMVVHYCGYPADMDRIIPIARKHNLKVIEDVSHAQGSQYKGHPVGSLGDIAATSMMGSKSFAVGEGGMLSTNDASMYEQALAFAHYERHDSITNPNLKKFAGLPMGGIKGRMNQVCAAMGRVQLKYYPSRIAEIQTAINRFWDFLKDTPGLRPHRPTNGSGSTMGGWYNPIGLYNPKQLDGLPVNRFIEAVNAEGGTSGRSVNPPLHLHPVLNEADIYGDAKPTRNAFTSRDVRQPKGSLPVSETIGDCTFGIPYFKHDQPEIIERHAAAFRKVALQAKKIL